MNEQDNSQEAVFTVIENYQAGDRESFVELWRHSHRSVWGWTRTAHGALLTDEVCEDLCSEVMVKVYNHLPKKTFHSAVHYFRWLKLVTVNHKTDFLRKEKHRRPVGNLDLGDLTPTVSGEAEASLEKKERMSAVRQGLGRLAPDDELILRLHLYEDKSFDDISQMLEGRQDKTEKFKKRYYRALKKLKKMLQGKSSGGDAPARNPQTLL